LLSDDTIEKQIEVASTTVEEEKSNAATTEAIEDAKLVLASYLSYAAYVNKLERGRGDLPVRQAREQLLFYERLAERMMSYVKRGEQRPKPVVDQTKSLYDVLIGVDE